MSLLGNFLAKYGKIESMRTRQKKMALATGLLSLLGVAALWGHRRQMDRQAREEAILREVRQFFEPMGTISVVYMTAFYPERDELVGGVVFDDQVVFDYRYHKGQIDYKLEETL